MKQNNIRRVALCTLVIAAATFQANAQPKLSRLWTMKPGVKNENGEISPDGSLCAIHCAPTVKRGEIHIRKPATGDLIKKFVFVESCNEYKCYEVESQTWTPDGQYLAAAGNEAIKIYKYATGEVVYTAIANQADGMRAHPKQNFIAVGNGKNVQIISVPDFKVQKSISGHGCAINSIDFTPDGKYMVTGSCDKKGMLWELPGFTKKATYSATESIKTIRITSDGKYVLAAAGGANIVFLYSASGQKVGQVDLKAYTGNTAENYVDHAEFSPDGKYFVTQGKGKDLLLFDVPGCKLVSRTTSTGDGEYMHWHKGYLLVCGSDGEVSMFKASGGETTSIVKQGRAQDFAHSAQQYGTTFVDIMGKSLLRHTNGTNGALILQKTANGVAAIVNGDW